MKKLLTGKEMMANCRNVYNADYTAFTVEGEPRGEMKQVCCDWVDKTDYIMLETAFKKLGLDDYIKMCYDDNKLYIRIAEEV